MEPKRKEWLMARILSVMEFWIGEGDAPFIYKNFYHNQLKFWHTDIEWGNIRSIPYSARLANPPEDSPITVISSDDELRQIFKGVYTENLMSEVASPYTVSAYKIILLVALVVLAVALAALPAGGGGRNASYNYGKNRAASLIRLPSGGDYS